MHIVQTWCENTEEGRDYLRFLGYEPLKRLTAKLWLVRKIGSPMEDVTVIR